MSIPYAKPVDCLDIIPSLTAVIDTAAELESSLQQSLLDASRLFESEIIAPVDFFKPAGEDFESRVFYGKGTEFIHVDPYTELEFVNDVDGDLIDAEEYRANISKTYSPTDYYIRWNYTKCISPAWWYSQVTVSAKWGFPCVPPDVVVAVKNMGCLMFLVNSHSRLGLNTDNVSEEQEARLRNTYNRIMQRWQDKFRHREIGI